MFNNIVLFTNFLPETQAYLLVLALAETFVRWQSDRLYWTVSQTANCLQELTDIMSQNDKNSLFILILDFW
jgi:hypothetical protein